MRKILITGAFSTGKTTLVGKISDALKKADQRVSVLDDLARSCPFPLNQDQNFVSSVWLVTTQISRELESTTGTADYLLCDRGTPDILSHWAESQLENSPVDHLPLMSFAKEWINTYDVVLYCALNPEIEIVPDGLRSTDEAFRSRLDGHLRALLCGRKRVIPVTGSQLEREKKSLQALHPF